jgi:hypothetical protein
MRIKKSKTIGAAVALATLVAMGGASVALADNTSHSFNATIPALQQSHYMTSYNRATSSTASTIYFSSISNSQLMNVKAQNLQNNAQYTEIKGIGPGYNVSIPNSTPTGYQSRLIVTNYDWNLSSQTAIGSFIIH